MLERKNKGIRLELKGNKLIIDGEVKINLRRVCLFIIILVCVILVIASSMSEGIRNILLEALLNLLQLMLFQRPARS
jgi:hypothetical protein